MLTTTSFSCVPIRSDTSQRKCALGIFTHCVQLCVRRTVCDCRRPRLHQATTPHQDTTGRELHAWTLASPIRVCVTILLVDMPSEFDVLDGPLHTLSYLAIVPAFAPAHILCCQLHVRANHCEVTVNLLPWLSAPPTMLGHRQGFRCTKVHHFAFLHDLFFVRQHIES